MSDQSSHWQQVHQTYDQVVADAWADPALKERLLREPRQVFDQYGIPVPADVELRVYENTPGTWHFVVPGQPDAGSGETVGVRAASFNSCC